MRFTDRSDDLEHPAVDGFLSAVDSAMNSNTLLLKFAVDVPVTAENQQRVLHAFLRSGLFEEMMYAADRRRDWYNLSDDWHADEIPTERPLLRDGFRATGSPLDAAGFTARLRWMLCEAFSPYGRHFAAPEAERLVGEFTRQLLGRSGRAWLFAAVEPDFLRSTGYFSGEEPLRPAYFDGGDCDTATFIHRDQVCYLLLTNGSP
ncbi:hypothetical protein HYE82_29105 [Streptomyces sp. BR123]|uniref:hypothetical protein n=1 Tax=Streptomyces sp. BR123 TaxID=2749828 RepID=UPI0015C4BDE4|nr:hypothetical protein [Streptomyces sp. BR123]NXY98360.1 hypothetical protein [Streptomyces sp. BR123]